MKQCSVCGRKFNYRGKTFTYCMGNGKQKSLDLCFECMINAAYHLIPFPALRKWVATRK